MKKEIIVYEYNNDTKRVAMKETVKGNKLGVEVMPRMGEKIILQDAKGTAMVYQVYDIHHNGSHGDYEEVDTEVYIVMISPLEDYISYKTPDISA